MTRLDGLTRFGQVNFTAADVDEMDPEYWREVWSRADLQAVSLNVGGSVAYYPSDVEGHPRLPGVGDRDPFGAMVEVARGLGIEVVARLDVCVVDQRFCDLHPDWMMTGPDGRPLTLHDVTGRPWGRPGAPPIEDELYYTCVNSDLFRTYLPAMLTEIAERYDVAAFFTNGFPTLGLVPPSTRLLCHCPRCLEAWADFSGGLAYPAADDPDDPVFRTYVAFLQHCTLEVLRSIQAHTRAQRGGPTFITSAIPSMAGALPWSQWADTLDVVVTDNQDRALDHGRATPPAGLWEVGLSTALMKSVARGRPAVRIMGAYRFRQGRHTSKDPAELSLQLALSFAHGEHPKWHTISGRQWSRRWTDTAVAFDRWLASSGVDLGTLPSAARVGVAWSQQSAWHETWVSPPSRGAHYDAVAGWYVAVQRSGVPVDLVNADLLDGLEGLDALVLPSGFTASEATLERIARFVEGGGGLVAVGNAGLLDEWGRPHPRDIVGGLLGIVRGETRGPAFTTYLRRTGVPVEERLMLAPDDDDVVPSGQWVTAFEAHDAEPAFAVNPQEWVIPTHAAWLPGAYDGPAVALATRPGRTGAYLGPDLDVAYFHQRVGDHLAVLRGALDHALGDRRPPVRVLGDAHVDVHALTASDATYVTLVNLHHPGASGGVVEHLAPLREVRMVLSGGLAPSRAELLRSGTSLEVPASGELVVDCVTDVEVVRITPHPGSD
ncbi:beta-galactosidase trimerization domain-containing protein [Phycicoccus sp. BSK3Z-2]|uniref:Beta-galactosidase trimerization domain-containing protein n=1 Tax=Phycicoccus avicenniae TaxID=2828860 RepID=A0A941D539_9MICO|nr:beta-galactosidase trimerization domain-containing protein [Phycicoccus avicenniae]MBR7741703.1 beta-galactosidase trimerization domain-containing protein [Phycicoccus avicenniae]